MLAIHTTAPHKKSNDVHLAKNKCLLVHLFPVFIISYIVPDSNSRFCMIYSGDLLLLFPHIFFPTELLCFMHDRFVDVCFLGRGKSSLSALLTTWCCLLQHTIYGHDRCPELKIFLFYDFIFKISFPWQENSIYIAAKFLDIHVWCSELRIAGA